MKSQFRMTSIVLLFALVLSLVPALALPSNASAATCDQAQFVSDVSVPDGSQFDPGAAFKKTWRLKNIGTCTWTTSYALVFDTGEKMGAPASISFPASVAPGQTVDLTVDMAAPANAGHYIGYWKFKNASGVLFGIGATASKSFWVDIYVKGSSTTGVVYDFTTNAGSATWSSGSGGLSFPGTDGDVKGFALKKDKPKYETGSEGSQAGLLFAPQNITNGFIQGRYPAFKVQSGDRFQSAIGCEYGATACYVAYRLDYEAGGTIKTFWTFRERYEGMTYNANLDLSPLAGQEVKFILYISAYGSPAGDRALWGNPVIVRKGSNVTPPPVVTATITNTPGPITPTVPPSACDKVQYVADVNIPDGTVLQPGAQFTKTWRLKNIGTCAWSTSYQLAFFSGEKMSASSSAAFPQNVAVGQTIDISINMTAPSAAGSYRGYWMFKNANGALFGIGAQGNKPWWVDIKVAGPTVTPGGPTKTSTPITPSPSATPGGPSATPSAGTAYDFTANACNGTWFSGAGQLPCPGTDGDAKGFVLKLTNPKLETGATDSRPALLTFPQNVQNGYIQGFYPPFKVQSGDHFQSTIGCEGGATNCYVAFRLDYQTGSDPIKTFWGPFLERYEGQVYSLDIDLSALAGKDVKFILTTLSAGSATGDRALWVAPRIFRPTGGTVPTPTLTPTAPTPTFTPSPAANVYQNTKYNFKFTLPSGAVIASQADNTGRVNLPIASGTNLSEKYIQVSVVEGANPCVSPLAGGSASSENVTINNILFVKQTGQEGAAGNFYDWVAYSTARNNACVSLAFVLHSTNPANYPTPPPVFDKLAESAVFTTIMSSFNFNTSIVLQDDFSTSGIWGTGADSDSTIEYRDKALHMLVFAKNLFVWTTPNDNNYQNVHIEVTVTNNGSDPATAFGVICNAQATDRDFYYFAVTPAGDYTIAKAATGQADLFLTNNNRRVLSNLITQNALSYRVGADCGNGKLTLYVNGQQIASISDSLYTNGRVGLFTWSAEDVASADVSFDDFVMTQL